MVEKLCSLAHWKMDLFQTYYIPIMGRHYISQKHGLQAYKAVLVSKSLCLSACYFREVT